MKRIFLTVFVALFWTTTQAKTLTVLLDWFANPSHAPLFVAQQQGYFKEQGLDVELIGPADPSDPPKLVAAGKADIAITYQPQFMEQVDRGLPLIFLGTLIDKPLSCLVVLKNSSIFRIADLKGKRIGFSGSSMSNVTLKTMLKTAHLTLKDVELINAHYDLTQALLSKKLDAVIGVMRTFEIIQMQLAGQPGRPFFPERYGFPTYSELILVIHSQSKKDPRLPRFLLALKKAVGYLRKHPEETWQLFSKEHPELQDELNHRAWIASIPYFANDPSKINRSEWLQLARFLKDNGVIKS